MTFLGCSPGVQGENSYFHVVPLPVSPQATAVIDTCNDMRPKLLFEQLLHRVSATWSVIDGLGKSPSQQQNLSNDRCLFVTG